MPLQDQIKNYAKKLVEDRPDRSALNAMVRVRQPVTIAFSDDGIVRTIRTFRCWSTAAR